MCGVVGWCVLPSELLELAPGALASGGQVALVHGDLCSHVGDVSPGLVEPLDTSRCMPLLGGIDEEVVGEDPWYNVLFPHHEYPGPHEEPNHRHGEGAPLGDGAPMLVWEPDVFAHLVVGEEVFLKNT